MLRRCASGRDNRKTLANMLECTLSKNLVSEFSKDGRAYQGKKKIALGPTSLYSAMKGLLTFL